MVIAVMSVLVSVLVSWETCAVGDFASIFSAYVSDGGRY